MPSKLLITATRTKLATVFAEWQRFQRAEPEKYQAAAAKLVNGTPEDYGAASADHFLQVLAHVECKQRTPLKIIVEADPPRNLTLNTNDTIYDVARGLEWTRQTLSDKCVTHQRATQIAADCRIGGYTDWRLPTIKELLTLVDYERCKTAIDTTLFPDTKNDWYWSSSLYAGDSGLAWIVNFNHGYAYYYFRDSNDGFVRAVRSVAPASPGQ